MSLRLYAPGTRKNNRFWTVKGTVAGEHYEKSTGETERAAAEECRVLMEAAQCVSVSGQPMADSGTYVQGYIDGETAMRNAIRSLTPTTNTGE